MSLNCQICVKELELIDGIYICPDGHISHYTQEVMEEDAKNISERSRKIHTNNQEPTFQKVYKFFTIMYLKMKKYYEIDSDLSFKIMLTYHHGDTIDIFTFNCLYTILYYGLRAQRERCYKTLTKGEFENAFPRAYYMHNFNKYINEYNLVNNREIYQRFMLDNPVSSAVLLEWIKLFGNVCYKTKTAESFEPSVFQKDNLQVKRIFRAMVRRDEKIMNEYLKRLTHELGITCTEDVKYQFKRFCDLYLDDKRVFVPDYLISGFLYLYAAKNDLEIDLKQTEKTICYKEDIIDQFKREINEQIHMCKNKCDYEKYRKYRNEYEVAKTYKPMCVFKNKMNTFRYVFCVYSHSTEETFMWFVNNLALFMDHASNNNLQYHLDKEVKATVYMLEMRCKAGRRAKEIVNAKRKERKLAEEEKRIKLKANRRIKGQKKVNKKEQLSV